MLGLLMTFLGLIFAIALPFYVYKLSKENGHNPLLWTLLSIGAGIGIQFILPLFIGILLGFYLLLTGDDPEQYTLGWGFSFLLSVGTLVLSIALMVAILKHVNIMKEEEDFILPPSPPSDFGQME